MMDVISTGAAPGIAPLFRGESETRLEELSSNLAKEFKIETRLYRFDFAADPADPEYEMCLAFPIHGMVSPETFGEVLKRWT